MEAIPTKIGLCHRRVLSNGQVVTRVTTNPNHVVTVTVLRWNKPLRILEVSNNGDVARHLLRPGSDELEFELKHISQCCTLPMGLYEIPFGVFSLRTFGIENADVCSAVIQAQERCGVGFRNQRLIELLGHHRAAPLLDLSIDDVLARIVVARPHHMGMESFIYTTEEGVGKMEAHLCTSRKGQRSSQRSFDPSKPNIRRESVGEIAALN